MGACTFSATNRVDDVVDNERWIEINVTFSNSYATGGDTIDPTLFGLRSVDRIFIHAGGPSLNHRIAGSTVIPASATSAFVVPDLTTPSAPKLKLFFGTSGALAEATAASNNSTTVVRLIFMGN